MAKATETNYDSFTLLGKNLPAGVRIDLEGEEGVDFFGNGLKLKVVEVVEALPGEGLTEFVALVVKSHGERYTVNASPERAYKIVG